MKSIRILALLATVAFSVGCATSPPEGVSPVTDFEVSRYLGKWYEIARLDHGFERGLSNVTAEYSLNQNGTIKVLNGGYDSRRGRWSSAEGKAKFRGDESIGSLKVSFFGPFYGGYHIAKLDESYQYALVVGPTKEFLWVLAREPTLDENTYQNLLDTAESLGFRTAEIILVNHETPSTEADAS